MSDLTDWLGANRAAGVPAVIFGLGAGILVLAIVFGFLLTLATIAPVAAATVVFGLGLLVFLAWADVRNGTPDAEAETTREQDPLSVLKERYARGELSEEEFEHRVTMLLDVDEIAGQKRETELERA